MALLLAFATLTLGSRPADARPIRIVLVGDSITESLSTYANPGTDLGSLVLKELLSSRSATRYGWRSGGTGYVPAHRACSGGVGCLPAGIPVSTPWRRTGTWFDLGQHLTAKASEGADGMPSTSREPGSWTSTRVTGDSISVITGNAGEDGTVKVLVDQVSATVDSLVAGSRTIAGIQLGSGEFIPGQSLSGPGLQSGTKVTAFKATGLLGGLACPCVSLDRPVLTTTGKVSLSAAGPSPRTLVFGTGSGNPTGMPQRHDLEGLTDGTHSLAVGNAGGAVTFLGAVAERTRTPGRALVINRVARSSSLSSEDIAPAQLAALRLLRADLTVNLRGTNDEFIEDFGRPPNIARGRFDASLDARFELATQTGGCMYVPHAPNPRLPSARTAAYLAIARAAAGRNRCDYVNAFAGLWTRSTASRWTQDGTHPTPKGYAKLARALASAIASRKDLQ